MAEALYIESCDKDTVAPIPVVAEVGADDDSEYEYHSDSVEEFNDCELDLEDEFFPESNRQRRRKRDILGRRFALFCFWKH